MGHRLDIDGAIELLDNHLGYCKTEAHTPSIDTLSLLQHSKELEQVLQVFLSHPNATICNFSYQIFVSVVDA